MNTDSKGPRITVLGNDPAFGATGLVSAVETGTQRDLMIENLTESVAGGSRICWTCVASVTLSHLPYAN